MANPAAPAAGGKSFLQAIATVTEEAPPPLRVAQMEGLAVLKIIKHCEEFAPALVTGQLLGLDVGRVLEVTNCFPFPTREDDEEADTDGANYQLEMMRCLREVNVDNNTVGCLWDWQAKEHCEPSDANHDVAKFVWDCLNQDDDDDELLGMPGNQTPLRDCRAFFDIGDISCQGDLDLEESRESKRRRVLEYPSEFSQPEFGDHEMGCTSVMSEVTETSLLCTDELESLNWDVQHSSNNLDKISSLSTGAPYRPSDNHSESCSDGTTTYYTPDQMPSSQESVTYIDVDGQTDVQGTSETAPVTESLIMQETRKLSTLKVSKGGSSLIKVKQNITTSIAYPFTLIKPSWEEGDVTLKDINQRIHSPPKKPLEILGTSAFSGKPVINKTRIRTEGGKGSITILRTKG